MRALHLFTVLLTAKILVVALRDAPAWPDLVFLWQDILVVSGFAVFDRVVRYPAINWFVYGVLAVYTAINVAVVGVVSAPVTLEMLAAVDGTIADSIRHYVSGTRLLPAAAVIVLAAVLPLWRFEVQPRFGGVLIVVAACVIGSGVWLTGRVTAAPACNAVVALAASWVPRIPARPSGETAWRRPMPAPTRLGSLRGSARRRNVVLVVLESVGARYLAPYGADVDPMPNLTRLAAHSLLFRNAYAVYPESIKGLVAMLYSVHPALDTEPGDYREIAVPSLGTVLRGAGYDTALVHSGRFAYLGMHDVLANAGYASSVDAGDIGGNRNSSFGVDETAAVDAVFTRLDRYRNSEAVSRPFFITYMPIAGHHPYDSPEAGPFDASTVLGAYRNAIHYADQALARLVDGLRQRGLWRDTVLVVVGDHGQAFGQHPGNVGHTFYLYEENVHVPFLIRIPGVVEERIDIDSVTSHVDLVPTVLDLLGLENPPGYEGRSMLAPQRCMALMFTDYSQAFVGLRDGRFKFVHQVESGRSLLFDLDADPNELRDVGGEHVERVRDYRQHLLDWAASRRDAVSRW